MCNASRNTILWFGTRDICALCAAEEAETDQELKKKYKTVLLNCITCKEEGKTPVIQRPLGKQLARFVIF